MVGVVKMRNSELHVVKQKLKRLMPHHVKDNPNTGRPRKIEDNKLRELHAQGFNDEQIAKKIGCSKTTVRIRRNKLGLPINNPITVQPRKVYDDTIRKIIEMNAKGLNDMQIANALKLSERNVWFWRNKKLGLHTNATERKFGTFKTLQNDGLIDGLTNKQIAKIAGVKVSTVGCWRFRSKKKEQAEGK
jgi:DNA-binding CsgD family transcriptional regulator